MSETSMVTFEAVGLRNMELTRRSLWAWFAALPLFGQKRELPQTGKVDQQNNIAGFKAGKEYWMPSPKKGGGIALLLIRPSVNDVGTGNDTFGIAVRTSGLWAEHCSHAIVEVFYAVNYHHSGIMLLHEEQIAPLLGNGWAYAATNRDFSRFPVEQIQFVRVKVMRQVDEVEFR